MNPPILYKYREDSELTERVLLDQQVWLSNAELLNDPLECRTGTIPEEWRRQIIRQMEEAQIAGLIVGMPGSMPPKTLYSLDERATRKWFKALKKLPHHRRVKKMHALHQQHGIKLSNPSRLFEKFEEQLSNVGIFSLTESADNQPMWAHYAGNHTGLVLGFGTSENSKLGDVRHTLQVTYNATKPTFSGGLQDHITFNMNSNGTLRSEQKLSFDDPIFRASFSTKPPEWSYEREWRFVEETSGLHDFPGELYEMTFGCKMPVKRRKNYVDLLSRSGLSVRLFEIRLSDDGAFERKPIS